MRVSADTYGGLQLFCGYMSSWNYEVNATAREAQMYVEEVHRSFELGKGLPVRESVATG